MKKKKEVTKEPIALITQEQINLMAESLETTIHAIFLDVDNKLEIAEERKDQFAIQLQDILDKTISGANHAIIMKNTFEELRNEEVKK